MPIKPRKGPSKAVSTLWVVVCLFWLDTIIDKLRHPQDHVPQSHAHTYFQLALYSIALIGWSIAAWRAWRAPKQEPEPQEPPQSGPVILL